MSPTRVKHLGTLLSLAAVVVMLASCATTANYEKILDSWVGARVDALVGVWGPPKSSYPLSSGGKVIEYVKEGSVPVGGFTYYSPVTTYSSGTMNVIGSRSSAFGSYSGTSTAMVPQTTPVYNIPLYCKTLFTANPEDIIVSWKHEGNHCVARAPAIQEPQDAPKTVAEKVVAREDGSTVKNLDPKYSEWIKKNIDSFEQSNWPEVIRTASAAISIDSSQEAPHLNRAWAYYKRGLFDEAVEDCNRAVEINPSSVSAYTYRGLAYAGQGRMNQALSDVDKALEIDGKSLIALNNRGVIYQTNGVRER